MNCECNIYVWFGTTCISNRILDSWHTYTRQKWEKREGGRFRFFFSDGLLSLRGINVNVMCCLLFQNYGTSSIELLKTNSFGVDFRFGNFHVSLQSSWVLTSECSKKYHITLTNCYYLESAAIKNKFDSPIRNHSPFVMKLEMSPPSSDFNTKSSCFVCKSEIIAKGTQEESVWTENRNVLFHS